MEERIETKNAKIESTFLGIEDHGITTCYLQLYYGGAGQGFGGYALDTPKKENGKFIGRFGTAQGMQFIMEILKVVEVEHWEQLPGKFIRARANMGKVLAIGHPLKDVWLDCEKFWKKG